MFNLQTYDIAFSFDQLTIIDIIPYIVLKI